ncbi:hypothetical protein PHMEG_00035590 [Phytophthora megakarya]|uniref:C2H2-type domain-containing protein n=1 Tax=Phytophthora megakarya TaxID=4795 RepID=A0A225UNS5_9STRA|nr:hypothetical protein PHMEG_00035590 [Phytophthora megakarya]
MSIKILVSLSILPRSALLYWCDKLKVHVMNVPTQYTCDVCLYDFARSDNLRHHQRRPCRGLPEMLRELGTVCWQWVKGNNHHLTRHQRSSRCRSIDDQTSTVCGLPNHEDSRDEATQDLRDETVDRLNPPFPVLHPQADALVEPTEYSEGLLTVDDAPDLDIEELLDGTDFDWGDIGLNLPVEIELEMVQHGMGEPMVVDELGVQADDE